MNVIPLEAALRRNLFSFLQSVLTNTTVRAGFVVDKVALGKVFLPGTSVFFRHHSTNAPHSFIRL